MDVKRLTPDEMSERWSPLEPLEGYEYGEVPYSRLRVAERQGWKLVALNLTAPQTPALIKREEG